ncbi:hypothetical protein COS31_00870 [Candidatus Roizmanbacteria bacterium CG02_land_8_20_14_3_00_36_15]|uniref:Uncharacterized protein n=2 Tax=Candidatus Roizmaniibacteriota TaxID=1752723 RepID=A0A2M8KJU6_9BACT|nr:MAG: hypothetical protein COS31_00870 [Candidatus Roizmanbacteria bacterium CG02_land_8_20_14_3_00_36_15]PIY69601.1 MAG: hypothetical protein COY89_05540 [Candidatus Roizmanbacteria bacterium CG_4_10_14_0_8_um_filter_36_36]PJA53677.1 MAG: hypothetical protein CO166_00835 [Candidatus Roizmanbacteria bacterium CG_4_9_14_3_um_filter_36_11]PJC81837.1 MAG: hypothetical protein CO007_02595 [Candidatus Roizmanbacteria bacterium CG_4_8_14_3_um_filter_36_10]PJE60182.1 MAG: hypothetical protein COU86_
MSNENRISARHLFRWTHILDILSIRQDYQIDPFPYSEYFIRKKRKQTLIFGRQKESHNDIIKSTRFDLLFSIDKIDLTREELIKEIINHGWIDLINPTELPFSVSKGKVDIFKKIVSNFNTKLKEALNIARNGKDPELMVYEFKGIKTVRDLFRDFRREAAVSSGLNEDHSRFTDYVDNPCDVKLQWRQDVDGYLHDPLRRDHNFLRAEVDWLYTPEGWQRTGYGMSQCCG